MNDIKNYNCAMGKRLIAYGVIYILLGLPMLNGQNSPFIILSALGVMVETIVAMAIYTLMIVKKYKKNESNPSLSPSRRSALCAF